MKHSRRNPICSVSVWMTLTAFALSACATRASEPQSQRVHPLEVSALAPGVWLHTSTRTFGQSPFPSHGLIVEGDDGVALIDTAWGPEDTTTLLAWIDREIGKPVTDVLITHAHDDRMGGLAEVRAAGARTHAYSATAAAIAIRGSGEVDHHLADDAAIERAGLRIEAFHPGPGHTRDNIVAYVPSQAVLFGGCLIRPGGSNSMGNIADGDLAQWGASALRAGERFPEARLVVPSHGAPGDRSLLAHTDRLAEAALAES